MKRIALSALGTMLLVVSNAFALELEVENKTGKELHELYFAPAGEEDWGPDQLGDEIVENNATFTLNQIPKGRYDVMFVDENNAKCSVYDVDFSASEHYVMNKKDIKNCQSGTDQTEGEEDEE